MSVTTQGPVLAARGPQILARFTVVASACFITAPSPLARAQNSEEGISQSRALCWALEKAKLEEQSVLFLLPSEPSAK